jgi:SAM-dependent methyltransferase
MPAPPVIFDRSLHARRLGRAAPLFSAANFLKRRAAEDLVERLETINRRFDAAADLGARDGTFARVLSASPAAAKVGLLVETDHCLAMLSQRPGPRVVAGEERMPCAAGALNLVVSSLALHWVNDLVGTLVQVRLALAPDGLFIGAILGGATLTELRRSLLTAETELAGGAGPRVSPFVDAADAGGLLQRAGFALPVVDTDLVSVRYDHPLKLLADLRSMGETSALLDRPRAPLSRAVLRRACETYQQTHGDSAGRVPATFEILTLTAWTPHESQQKPLRPGSAKARLADALGAVEISTGEKPIQRTRK